MRKSLLIPLIVLFVLIAAFAAVIIYYTIWNKYEYINSPNTFDFYTRPKSKKSIKLLTNKNTKYFIAEDNVTFSKSYNNIPRTIIMTFKDKTYLDKQKIEWSKLNPSFKIEVYDDKDCEEYLLKKYGEYHHNIFKNVIKDGPIKADYFRIHRLKEGGIYVDIDMEPINLDYYKDRFVIPYTSWRVSKWIKYQLNPCLIITPPNHSFILQAIKAYEIISVNINYSYWAYSVVTILSALNIANTNKIPKILLETKKLFTKHHDVYLYDVEQSKELNYVRLKNYNSDTHDFN
jgi:hypothetical protein